jgi:hypothetical protein
MSTPGTTPTDLDGNTLNIGDHIRAYYDTGYDDYIPGTITDTHTEDGWAYYGITLATGKYITVTGMGSAEHYDITLDTTMQPNT